MTSETIISRAIIPLSPSDSIGTARHRLEISGHTHLPVTEGNGWLGMVSLQDISMVTDPDMTMSDFKNGWSGFFAREDMHLLELIRLFALHDTSLLPVISPDGRYLGCVSASDALRLFAGLMRMEKPGSIVVLEVKENEYSMQAIVQLVESNDCRILHYWLSSPPGADPVEITMKTDRTDIGPLLQAFFRLNYTVKASWSLEDTYHEGLQDRFDALMNYLSI